jgi:NitT/TauT family transport system ATP-binding protein
MRPAFRQAYPVRLELRNISKHVQTGLGPLHVLDAINLTVRKGEFLCILGPSGSGKSTLFHVAAGLEPPDSGQVLVDGVPAVGPGPDRVALFQEGTLFPWLTVRGNVEFGLSLQMVPPGERRRRAEEAMELLRLGRTADLPAHQLSEGMCRRAAIARAIAMRPKVLLMDEPFASLDAQTRNVLQEELQRVWTATGLTVLFLTRNVAEAVRLGDRVALLAYRPGRVKREVAINQPRPRLMDDPHVLEIRTFLLRSLMADVRSAIEEELGGR